MSSSTASKLDGLVGLYTAKHFLRRLAQDERGIHAILLYGAKGSGKTELARMMTEMWLCTNPGPDGADGTCRACGAYGRGTGPDNLDIEPMGSSSIIQLPQITNEGKVPTDPPLPLLKFLRTPPLYARHKVCTIHSAHRMNSRAANALLKTLEEPHPYARIILTTESVGSILPTIRSRCLAIACESPTHIDLKGSFPSSTNDEVRLSEGTPGRMHQVSEQHAMYSKLIAFARHLPNRRQGEALVASEEFAGITALFKGAGDTGARSANAEALNALAIFYAREPTAPPQWTQLIIEAHRRIIGNGQASIVFDALFAAMLTNR